MSRIGTRFGGLRARSTAGYDMRFPAGAPSYHEVTENPGQWRGTRPGFSEATWELVLSRTTQRRGAHGQTYQCAKCGHFVPKKGVVTPGMRYITLDHSQPWDVFIREHAAPSDDGTISQTAAHDAYNDTFNLVPMCNTCNSAKNGHAVDSPT